MSSSHYGWRATLVDILNIFDYLLECVVEDGWLLSLLTILDSIRPICWGDEMNDNHTIWSNYVWVLKKRYWWPSAAEFCNYIHVHLSIMRWRSDGSVYWRLWIYLIDFRALLYFGRVSPKLGLDIPCYFTLASWLVVVSLVITNEICTCTKNGHKVLAIQLFYQGGDVGIVSIWRGLSASSPWLSGLFWVLLARYVISRFIFLDVMLGLLGKINPVSFQTLVLLKNLENSFFSRASSTNALKVSISTWM